jgi:hypothetical protein
MSKPKNIILENGSVSKYEISSKIMKIKILASQILKNSSLMYLYLYETFKYEKF